MRADATKNDTERMSDPDTVSIALARTRAIVVRKKITGRCELLTSAKIMMVAIKLPRGAYTYDSGSPIAQPGGFGQVFAGATATGQPVAVKKLKITPEKGHHRELKIVDQLAGKPF